MGVCKCKQRNVTNQFCYVCRMNVCESCMVKDHQRVCKNLDFLKFVYYNYIMFLFFVFLLFYLILPLIISNEKI